MTGVRVLAHDAPREVWLAARSAGIGASEIAAVMGIGPYDSPFSLWWRKRMNWETEANAEMATGTFLEPVIADWWAEHADPIENLMVRPAGLYRHSERRWQLATPDRLLYFAASCVECGGWGERPDPEDSEGPRVDCDGCDGSGEVEDLVALLECKWVAFSWDGWGQEGTSVIPVHYRAQALWQMDVMGVDEVHICALGPGGFRVYRVRRDETDLIAMREQGLRFMASLAAGDQPDVDDHAATLPMVRRVHTDIEDREQEIPAPVASGWLRAKRFKALAESTEKRYAAMLRVQLGTAKTAVLAGRKFAARSTDNKLTRSKSYDR